MTFLIKIDYPLIDYIDTKNLSVYLPIKKAKNISHITNGQEHTVEIYSSKENGIIARGIIKQGEIKASNIPIEEQQFIQNKTFLQIEVFLYDYSESGNLLGNEIFDTIPALNHFKEIRPYNINTLYYAGDLTNEINILYKENIKDLCFINNIDTKEFRIKLFTERAKYVNRHKLNNYRNKINKKNNCDICFVKGYSYYEENGVTLYNLEKNLILNIRQYQEIKFENIVVLCSVCYNNSILKLYF